MEKITNIIEWGTDSLILDLDNNHSSIVFTADPKSKLTFNGQPATKEHILGKFREGHKLCVVLHPLVEKYGASLEAEFSICPNKV